MIPRPGRPEHPPGPVHPEGSNPSLPDRKRSRESPYHTLLDQTLAEIAQVEVGDRIVFDPGAMTSEEIREEHLYPCLR